MVPGALKDRIATLLGPRGYLDRHEDLTLYEYDGGIDKHRPDHRLSWSVMLTAPGW